MLAPVFDIFRLDLYAGHFYFLGQHWTLGLEAFQHGEISTQQAIFNLLMRGFLPIALIAAAFLVSSWRWGRLYCGWLCPHYSVVELINNLMHRASGKPSLWEPKVLPQQQADGRILKPSRVYWPVTLLAILLFSFIWAVSLLTYLLPPDVIYHNLTHAQLTRNQFAFITVATVLLGIEFTFARHFFCRYGCAVGFFQSLLWMANRRAMVVRFDVSRASACRSCNNACDNACPMRLKPRNIKRRMFACTQCAECISACTLKQQQTQQISLIEWVDGVQAQSQSEPPVGVPQRNNG